MTSDYPQTAEPAEQSDRDAIAALFDADGNLSEGSA